MQMVIAAKTAIDPQGTSTPAAMKDFSRTYFSPRYWLNEEAVARDTAQVADAKLAVIELRNSLL
jgi:hypothetical protein